ncbi:MAG: hypothetical protein AABY22_09450 [Nanoarchaeota archaeon]
MENKIKREAISVRKVATHYFLEITDEFYDILKAFPTIDDLIKELKKYPIENRGKLITEIKLRNTAEEMKKRGLPLG